MSVLTQRGIPQRNLRPAQHEKLYTSTQCAKLRVLNGCKSEEQCGNTSVDCKYGPEDPSDAFWLQSYNSGNELVVVVKVGLSSFIFFIVAIICDGAIFAPRRVDIARFSLFALFLIGSSALLLLLLVPEKNQFSLLGGGPLQSFACISGVMLGALVMPSIALLLQSVAIAYIEFLFFLCQVLFWTIMGSLHFFYHLLVLQSRHLWLQIQAVYLGPSAVSENDTYNRQITHAHTFVQQMSANPLLSQFGATVSESIRMSLQTVLPSDLYEVIINEANPPSIEDALEDPGEDSRDEPPGNFSTTLDETTPLVNRE